MALRETIRLFLTSSEAILNVTKANLSEVAVLLSADTPLLDDRILDPIGDSFQQVLFSSTHLIRCLGSLFWNSSVMLVKIVILMLPHLLRLGSKVVEFHRTQMSNWDILIEVTIISILLIFAIFRRRITAAWFAFEKGVAKKYKVVAKYAPHVLFFAIASLFAIVGRKFLRPLCSSSAMPVIIIAFPFYQTLKRLNGMLRNQYSDSLKYWIITSLYFGTKCLLSLVPFSSWFFKHAYVLQVLVLIVAVWIQLSSTCIDIVFDAVSPMLSSYVDAIPAADFGAKYGASIISVLKFSRILDDKRAHFLRELMADTTPLLLCLIFLFTPAYITTLGYVSIGMILPAFKTSKYISKSSVREEYHMGQEHWLKYWCCFAALVGLDSLGVGLWRRWVMVLFVWLQHSYFSGSAKIFEYIVKEATAVSMYHKRVSDEKRKTAQVNDEIVERKIEKPDNLSIANTISQSIVANPSPSQNPGTINISALVTTTPTKNAEEKVDLGNDFSPEMPLLLDEVNSPCGSSIRKRQSSVRKKRG